VSRENGIREPISGAVRNSQLLDFRAGPLYCSMMMHLICEMNHLHGIYILALQSILESSSPSDKVGMHLKIFAMPTRRRHTSYG
jgi:hypothetical protein